MKYILDTFAFLHLGTSVMYRVSYDKTVNIKDMLKETISYLDTNFENWKKSSIFKIRIFNKKRIQTYSIMGSSIII